MKPIRTIIVTILIITSTVQQTFGLIEEVIDIIKLGKDVTEGVLQTWELVEQTQPNEIDYPFFKKQQKKILNRMTELSRQINYVESETLNIATWTIDSINEQMKTNTQLLLGLHELSDLINRISTQNSLMQTFSDNFADLENSTLYKFAEWTISPSSLAIQGLLDRIHLLMTGSQDLSAVGSKGVLYMISDNLQEAKSQVCATRQSAQQVLFQLYSAISLTELKGYAMLQFSWMLLRTYGKGNYTRESQLMHNRFVERTQKTQLLLRKVMERADRTVWRCDPQQHIEGETYVAVTRLLQGFIENEVDMNNDGTCKENCAYYQNTLNYGCFKDQFCSRQPKCTGKILNCQFVDSDMWICPAKSSSLRRYEYIEYENGRVLGKKGSCTRGTTKVDSWWRWLFWHCSYCMCICDEQSSKSDRYFNLRESLSNVTANRVVTGLRFVKQNRVIHLQIQEGELLPRGSINISTVHWIPVSEYRLLDRGIRNGVDYHTMSWNQRAVDLDDLKAHQGHVVTGVRFRIVGSHLNLELRATEVDFVSGELIDPDKSEWVSNDNTEFSNNRRTPIILKRPDVPTNSQSKSIPDSKTNQYVDLTHTDIDTDVGQTTVPYFDAQEVTSFPPVPLTGVGIYHKGLDNYGGFIAPKLITFDFAPHIQMPNPKDTIRNINVK